MKNNSLKHHEILKSKSRIERLLRSGKRIHGDRVSLYYLPSEKMAFAVLIKNKTGKPVQRNRVKRWIREIYRNEKTFMDAPFELIIMVHKSYSELKYDSLQTEIINHLDTVKNNLS